MLRPLPLILGLLAITVIPTLTHAATKVACVGDSITQSSGWCEDLGTKLGSGYTVSNFGVSGTTLLKAGDSPYWNSNQYKPSHDFAPNVVVIMLGTNDSKPQNWSKKSSFVADYEALIDSYATLSTNPTIYACLPPPTGTNSFSISGTVIANEVLPLVRQAATNKGVRLIDIFTAFGGTSFDASLFGSTQDQVHPNAKGAQLIGDTVYAALVSTAPVGTGGSGGVGTGGSNTSALVASAGRSTTGGASNRGGGSSLGGKASAGSPSTVAGTSLAGSTLTGGTSTGGVANRGGSTSSGGQSNGTVTRSSVGGATNLGGQSTVGSSAQFGGTKGIGGASGGTSNVGTTTSNAPTGGQTNLSSGPTTTNTARGGTTSSTSTGTNDTTSSAPDSGCGCRIGHRSELSHAGSTFMLMLALLCKRRRRGSRAN